MCKTLDIYVMLFCLFKQLKSSLNSRLLLSLNRIITSPIITMATRMTSSGKRLIWVDCEMSDLDISKGQLLEIACIITDSQLNHIDSIGPLVIHTDKHILDSMNEWCRVNHGESGLVKECLNSQLTIQEIDEQLYQFCQSNGIVNGLLAGNSVSYDRVFLSKFCPKFSSFLHYRTVDVSTIKELVRLWYKKDESFKKRLTHRALDDIRESIDELKYYKENYFKGKNEKIAH